MKIPEMVYLIKTKAEKSTGNVSFVSTTEGFERVRNERYAFQCETLTAFPIIRDVFDSYELCDLNMVNKNLI